jgi:hypothetical protein
LLANTSETLETAWRALKLVATWAGNSTLRRYSFGTVFDAVVPLAPKVTGSLWYNEQSFLVVQYLAGKPILQRA